MSENRGRTTCSIPIAIWVAIIGCIATIAASVIAVSFPDILAFIKSLPMQLSPTPSCINADEIIVRFHILSNDEVIDTLTSGQSFFIEPVTTVQFQAEIISTRNQTLPTLECTWTNTGIANKGKLLQKVGCRVEYQSGLKDVTDSISLQLSQPPCPTFGYYPFFLLPKP